jgi:hypothetical protein
MLNSNRRLALIVAALALVLGSGLIAIDGHAAVPEHASSQLEQVASAQ